MTENFSWKDLPKGYDKLAHGKPFFRCVCDVAETYENL